MALVKNDNKGHRVYHVSGTPTGVESLFTDHRFIQRIVWYKPTSTGHDLYILTDNNKPWLGFTCSVNNRSENIKVGRYIKGMKISQLDSGELFIHYGAP